MYKRQADNFDERIEQKIFHAEIVVDNEKVRRETARYVKIPQIIDFTDKDGNVGPIGDTVKDAVKDAVNNGNNFNGVMVSAAFFF